MSYKITVTGTEISAEGVADESITFVNEVKNITRSEVVETMLEVVADTSETVDHKVDMLETRLIASDNLITCETTYHLKNGCRTHLRQIATLKPDDESVLTFLQEDVPNS